VDGGMNVQKAVQARRRLRRYELTAAGLVNTAMIAMAAVAFHDGTHDPRACRFRATLIALTGFSLLAGLQSRNLR
jgi:hypothetical protein